MILQMIGPVQGGLRQEKKFEIIANHLANVSTNGFKADILTFDHVFRAKLVVDHRQGDLKATGNKLDLALGDSGFFKVQTQRGIMYTRDGNFTIDRNNTLSTQNGEPVLGTAGPIIINGTDVNINEIGGIQVDGGVAGQLDIVTFNNLDLLQKQGNSLYRYKGSEEDEIVPENVLVKQGTLEKPNISIAAEMTKMIQTHRMYEAYQKMIHIFDEINSKAITEVGRA